MISYKPLWHILIENDMNKTDLVEQLHVSSATITKMSKNENVSMKVICDICKLLNCKIQDVIEYVPDPSPDTTSETH